MLSGCSFNLSPLNSCAAPTRIVSLNRIVHFNNLNRFVCAWTVLAGKIISYQAVKIRLRQKVILLENFDQKTIRFNLYYSYWKFWAKDYMVQPILSFKKSFTKRQYGFNPYCLLRKILIKRQYGSTHIVFWENFHQKTILFNPYCLLRRILIKRQNGQTHIVF